MAIELSGEEDYTSPHRSIAAVRRMFPSLFFYPPMLRLVWNSSQRARQGTFDAAAWHASSNRIIEMLESVGARFRIEGLNNIINTPGPCVFIGNHMSTLETFVLPSIIGCYKPVTFVVKKSLTEYPIFRHVMTSCDPVTVERANPREDFKVVMDEGTRRVEAGLSVIVFPQTTRAAEFNPSQFNTIGVKLAKRAGVPVIPVALKTDAWSTGRFVKDLGPIVPARPIRFAFGAPLNIEGNGQKQHAEAISFIEEKLRTWQKEESI